MKKTFVVIGATWFDKVNGNTYCNAKIIDTATGDEMFTGFGYGYDRMYFHRAQDLLKSLGEDLEEITILDGGCFKMSKSDLRNNNF